MPKQIKAQNSHIQLIHSQDILDDCYWTPQRIYLRELLWGKGNLFPNDITRSMKYIKKQNVTSTGCFLDLNMGVGGLAYRVHRDLGMSVKGMCMDQNLLLNTTDKYKKLGIDKKINVEIYYAKNLALEKNTYNIITANYLFYQTVYKDVLLDQINLALKEDGKLIFTDFVFLNNSNRNFISPVVNGFDNQGLDIWQELHMRALLMDKGFVIEQIKDETGGYIKSIMSKWNNILVHKKAKNQIDFYTENFLDESNFWSRIAAAMHEDGLRAYTFTVKKRS